MAKNNLYNCKYGDIVGSDTGYFAFRNNLRIKKFIKMIDPKKDENILEIGCNTGKLFKNIAQKCDNAYAVDVNRDAVARLNDNRIRFMSATELEFENGFFDKICSFEVFEHIEDIGKAFENVARVLKPGGYFFMSFPFEVIRGQTALLDAAMLGKGLSLARKLHVHKLTPKKVKKIIKGIPLTVVRQSVCFLPIPLYIMIFRKKVK